MQQIRKPFQGVLNILRFNWHFYVLATGLLVLLSLLNGAFGEIYAVYVNIFISSILIIILTSLVASFYIYDLSNLYSFIWLNKISFKNADQIVNINAGFDETSSLIKSRHPNAQLTVFDFYDGEKHTEVSIRRARRAHPPYEGTLEITTSNIPTNDCSSDIIYVIMSAHEIRNDKERETFFMELNRILKPTGKIVVTEHLRDLPNFLVYNIGAFHFMSRSSWYQTFKKANLEISKIIKITPFITTFILEKNGSAS